MATYVMSDIHGHGDVFRKMLEKIGFSEEEARTNQLTQDYLHVLELKEMNYHARAKLATNPKKCRIARREAKDKIDIVSPLASFADTDKGKMLIAQLNQVLGSVQKQKRYLPAENMARGCWTNRHSPIQIVTLIKRNQAVLS